MNSDQNDDVMGYDIRLTKFLGWIAVLALSLISAALVWATSTLVGLKSDVAVLLSRPEGVSRLEYNRDAKRWDDEIEEIRRQRRMDQ